MNPRKKIYISLAIFGLLDILFLILIISPLFKEIKKNSEELLLEKKNLISLSDEIKNLEESKNLYKAQQSNLEKIDELFVDPEVPIEFIGFLEKNALTSQLSIEVSLASAPKKEADPWPGLSFQISAVGPFPNFLKFLEKLEASPYLIEILNLNLKRLTGEPQQILTGSPGDVNATFLIKVFTQ